jgi:uncharacterized protein (DUF2235 family)
MITHYKLYVFCIAAVLLSGCSTTLISNHIPTADQRAAKPKKIAVFLDGTANDQASRTNIARLYELTTNHYASDVVAYYSEGVGTDGRIIGAITGWGIGQDVRDAYSFLSQYYNDTQDRIYIFGFSRGSYAARILAGFIQVAGLVDLKGLNQDEKSNLVSELFNAYKGEKSLKERADAIQFVLDNQRVTTKKDVKIEIMGLWDTIEALGTPNYKEDVGEVNKKYLDQICNIGKVFHVVSLDDNRARIYTPILMSSRHINKLCPSLSIEDIVEEVWFSGAHADVGGGYKEGFLQGVSLNWMISNIMGTSLLPNDARVYQDEYDVIHDAESNNKIYQSTFKRVRRHLENYLSNSGYNQQRIKIHQSVISRLSELKTLVQKRIDSRKNDNEKLETYDSRWYMEEPFSKCFKETERGFDFVVTDCHSITIVKNNNLMNTSAGPE